MSEKFSFGEGLVWWIGIVEHRSLDPKKIGICKVRAFDHHTSDKNLLPTEQLPDAYPAESLSAVLWSTPKEGDTVMGVFLDDAKQNMMMLFRIPTMEQKQINVPGGEGFRDARKDSELPSYPRQSFNSVVYSELKPISVVENAAATRYPPHPSAASVPFLSRPGEYIPSQISPNSRKLYANSTTYSTSTGSKWSEPLTKYAAVYPFNHVYESESLHVMEFDDSPGVERVHMRHRIGTGYEYFPDGTSVEKIVRDNYTITLGNNYIGISGNSHTHVRQNLTLLVEGDVTTRIVGDYTLQVDGDFKQIVKGDVITNTHGDSSHSVSGTMTNRADGTLYLKGSPIHENSGSTPDVETIPDVDRG